jgi:putative flippase GtrA
MVETSRQKRKLVFLGVGVINTSLDFSFYTLLTSTIFKNGHNIALAGFISGTFALLCAFITHSLITWKDTNISKSTFFKFLAFTGFGMWVVRPLLLSGFIHFNSLYSSIQRIIGHAGLNFSYNFVANTGAFALMLVIVLIYNFLTYDRYVFVESARHTETKNRSAS